MKIDFSNTEVAFQLKSNFQLRKAKLLFMSVSSPAIVRFLQKVVSFCFNIGLPIKPIIKATVFEHFCGGETIAECTTKIAAMYSKNVHSLLDYSVEGKVNDADFDGTKNTVIESIKYASSNPGIPFAVFKPSGVGSNHLYDKVSAKKELTPEEKEAWQRVRSRYFEIAQSAFDHKLKLMIDAEEVSTQQAVDDLVTELMEKYNQESCIVFNTAQMYRWDRLQHIKDSVALAHQNNYYYGIKIVRGAYMEKERMWAKKYGYKDPIQPNKAACDADYDAAVTFLLENVNNKVSVVVATHNAPSCQLVDSLMEKHSLKANDPRVYVAQLYAMSDNISFNMANAGHNVVKYLPFGPVKDVMPYLFRRAEENTAMKGQTSRELELIKQELRRRRKA